MRGIDPKNEGGSLAANSVHSIFDAVRERTHLPLISIVETAACHAAAHGMKKVLLLGIKHTRNADFYPKAFRKAGIAVVVPAADKDEIERIIFDEPSLKIVREKSRVRLLAMIARHDVDGVVLGCTELPLILKQARCPTPLIDTLDLHAEAAFACCLASAPKAEAVRA